MSVGGIPTNVCICSNIHLFISFLVLFEISGF